MVAVPFSFRKAAFPTGSIGFFSNYVRLFAERVCSSRWGFVLREVTPTKCASVARTTPEQLYVFLSYGCHVITLAV